MFNGIETLARHGRADGLCVLRLTYGELCDHAGEIADILERCGDMNIVITDIECMDDDDLRRGKPSCHKQFGESYALLAGDGLLTLAFETLTKATAVAPSDIVRAVCVLSNLAGINGMIGGQVIDLLSEEKQVDYDTLHCIDKLKTGALIKSAALLGCIAAGVQEEAILTAAKTYAENIGLAFQVVDDILDVTSDTETLGKPVGSDEKNAKSTFVSLLGLEACKTLADKLTKDAVQALSALPNDTAFLEAFANQLAVRKK